MSAVQNFPSCIENNPVCHAVKGTGYLVGSTGTALAVVGVAILVATIAIGLFASDGLFLYSYAVGAPLHLIWALPVTLAFVAIDCLVINHFYNIGKWFGSLLADQSFEWGEKGAEHFKAIVA